MNDRYTVERIMEIIAWVIGSHEKGAPLTAVDTSELYKQGYTDGEISAAISWILERGQQAIDAMHNGVESDSFRVLHGIESEVITKEAWGMLLSYQNLGFLSNEDIEQIIERAMVMGGETLVDMEELRAIVAVYVMNLDQDSMSGNRSLLSGNEQVN